MIKVALFGSFYRGRAVLETLLQTDSVKIVGVCSDNPASKIVSPHKRIWQYGYTEYEKNFVKSIAADYDIPFFNGSIKTKKFSNLFRNAWSPDILYVSTFGQLIPKDIFSHPGLGSYNIHPSVDRTWPSYVGGNPFHAMIEAGEKECALALHKVDEYWDHGELICFSRRCKIKKGDTPRRLHKVTSPLAGILVEDHLQQIIEKERLLSKKTVSGNRKSAPLNRV